MSPHMLLLTRIGILFITAAVLTFSFFKCAYLPAHEPPAPLRQPPPAMSSRYIVWS